MDSKGLIPGQPRSFEEAIKRAITSCQQSGNAPDHHFAGAGKVIAGVSCLGGTYHFARARKPIIFGKAEHIKQVEKRIKSIAPRVELKDKDAKGLIGEPENNES